MRKRMKQVGAPLLASSSCIWLPMAAACLASEPQWLVWLWFAVGVLLFASDDLRVWMFGQHITHVAFPPAVGIVARAWTQHGRWSDTETSVTVLVATAASALLSWFLWDASPVKPRDLDADPYFVRGVRRERLERVRARAEAALRHGEDTISFGPIRMALGFIVNNFFVLGAPGSGKTALSYIAMKSFLPSVTPGSGKRAVIYDAKTETISRLDGLGYTGRIIITNFTDARAAGWQLGADFREPHTIAEAAELLFPVPQGGQSQVFFDYSVRDLATGVMTSWNTRFPGCLTLRDLINSMESETRLRQVLGWDLEANYSRLALYFGQRDTLQNILATIASKLEPFRAIAAYWDSAPHRFCLTDFVRDSSVLVLGRSTEAQVAADTMNSLLIARLTQLLLKEENTDQTRTFVFLDELSKAGRLRHLDMLLLQGRSKGVRVWLGAQSVASLRATWGKDLAADLTAGCGNVAVLALADPDSVQWAEDTWSRQERWQESTGQSRTNSPHGSSYTSSKNWSLVMKPTVLASEFLALRPPSKRTGDPLSGFYRIPGIGSFAADIQLDELAKAIPDTTARGASSAEPDHIPAPWQHGVLRRWTPDELSILGLPQDDAGLPAPPTDEWPPAGGSRRPRRARPQAPPATLDDISNLFGKKKAR